MFWAILTTLIFIVVMEISFQRSIRRIRREGEENRKRILEQMQSARFSRCRRCNKLIGVVSEDIDPLCSLCVERELFEQAMGSYDENNLSEEV